MKTCRLSPFVRRLAIREWLALSAGMLLLAAGLGWQNGLGRLDRTLYDTFLSANARPARDDIIIVAIDDYSLAQLGRWPWPRTLHAELIERLNAAQPRAIGLDMILSEPEQAQAGGARPGDRALAAALADCAHCVLPVMLTNFGAGLTAGLPISELACAAQAIGHINLEHDSDGIVRNVFLREGSNDVWWPHFALALSAADNEKPANCGLPAFGGAGRTAGNWQRAEQFHIPFAGGSGHFQSVPYVSVLRGEVPAQFFADKYVLIGATALGMNDAFPTPVSGASGMMAGIEINANILAGQLDGKAIDIAPAWHTMLFSIVPVLIALLAYMLLSPRLSLLVTVMLLPSTLAASYAALRFGLWIAPGAALITLIVSYPLWSWRRLEAAIAYLGQEFIRLDKEPHLLPEERRHAGTEQMADILEQRINAMKNAARRVRDVRQFVSDNLDNLPDATLITSTDGRVLLANKHAIDYYASIGFQSIRGASVIELLSTLYTPQPIDQAGNASFDWPQLLDLRRDGALANGVAVNDYSGRDLLVKSAPCRSAANLLTGWIISIIDFSTIRAAERRRDEMLRFLSHDMRAPQASILALLELQNDPSSALPLHEFFSRVENASRKTLGLADNFVQLARAESQEYRLEEVDFQDLLFDASDEMWSLAKNKHIAIVVDIAEGEYPVHADRALMTRALTNLLSNAVNYSPERTRIVCTVRVRQTSASRQIVCSIRDQGYGIAAADQTKLFRRFQRVDLPNQPRHDGAGLGLVFVKTVLERHHGNIGFTSTVGEGTTFTIVLPCQQAQ
jgi:CHASE2 domain-containing sensor protein/signal transduction histidine kinase